MVENNNNDRDQTEQSRKDRTENDKDADAFKQRVKQRIRSMYVVQCSGVIEQKSSSED